MPFIEDLIQSIDSRIRAASGEIVSLEDARAALTSNGSTKARSDSPRTRRTRRRKGRKKTTRTKTMEGRLADEVEGFLAQTNGVSTTALAKEAGADRDQVLALLRDLEKRARVRRTGQRRATRWHAITDEDRIQERAAELDTRRRRRPTTSSGPPAS